MINVYEDVWERNTGSQIWRIEREREIGEEKRRRKKKENKETRKQRAQIPP